LSTAPTISVVMAWFALRGPTTVDGALRYAEALFRAGGQGQGHQADPRHMGRRRLLTDPGGDVPQALPVLLEQRGSRPPARPLMWDGRIEEARRMLPRVDADHGPSATPGIKLATMSSGVEYALRKVPERLAHDQGLVFERLRWRRRKGQEQAALDMLRQAPTEVSRPEIWWSERAYLARRAITAGRMSEA